MIFIQNLTVQHGKKILFAQVDARINPEDRIGLVGVNGAGKSTLLRLLAGLQEADNRAITRARGVSVAYLPQEMDFAPSGRTLYQEAETVFADLAAQEAELSAINQQLAAVTSVDAACETLLARQAELQHALDQADIYRLGSRIEKILAGLGFSQTDLSRPCHTFSGGWLMRLHLAKLLLAQPSVLLLDEPTNHLDLESLTWLEEFLAASKSAMVIVSHDRAFLDRVTNLTWELSLGKLTRYRGNYSAYVAAKATRQEVLQAAYANQQQRIQQTMRFVERFRATSTKASQVQSRLKQLEKMERIELEEAEKAIRFRFPASMASGRVVVEVVGLAKSYDGKAVLRQVSFSLQRGDKLAVVGVNGAGKSTLMRLIVGQEKPDQGRVRLGYGVVPSFFGQHQAQELDPGRTALETLAETGREMTITEQRSLLGAFLFRGDEVDKKVQVLSGGEKSRLALAKMIATPANLLLMDEPTNHLDMTSQEVLQEALVQYDGTVIVVSHNRYFLNRFVNRVLQIKDGTATLFEGDLDDYRRRLEGQTIAPPPPPVAEPAPGRGKAARQDRVRRLDQRNRLLAPWRQKATAAEQAIEALERRKAEMEAAMAASQVGSSEALAAWTREYRQLETQLKSQYTAWETALAKVSELEAAGDEG
ncbi:MAG: ABC-F family ATP-binding cassette domain-containing protein [Thermodesulfobacteriota bacterium]